ncbi:MAG: hypothetical protein DDT31_00762 [Syntrophomonadaceae bacterium]|nr:hypothetical protein [Bacillota bacterium]
MINYNFQNKKHQNKQSGFSLFELILVLSLVLLLTSTQLSSIRADQDNVVADAAGDQLRKVGSAVNSYVAFRYDRIIALQDAIVGDPLDPGPRDCDPTTARCNISIQTLVDNGLLPSTFSGVNSFGSTYEIQILRSGTAPIWIVDAFVITTNPFTTDGVNIRYDLLGRAMQRAGPDAGITRTSASTVDGFNGTWQEQSVRFPIIDGLGRLAYRAGYGTQAFAAYLRLDGTTPMTGTLQLGGNSIVGVEDLTMEDGVLTVTRGVINMTSPSPGVLMPMITVDGTEFITNSAEMRIANDGGLLDVVRRTGVGTFAPGTIQAGEVFAETNLWSNGNVTAAATVSAGQLLYSAGDIQSVDDLFVGDAVVVAGQASIGGNATINRGLIVGENIETFTGRVITHGNNGWFNQSWNGGFFMADPSFIRTYNNVGIFTSGEIRAGTLTSLGRIQVGEYIQFSGTSIVGLGAPCTDAGAIALSGSGALVNCSDGSWQQAGVSRRALITGPPACAPNAISNASCPPGSSMINGGYRMTQFNGGTLNAPDSSFPSGINTFTLVNNAQGSACFQAVVLCQQ